MPGYRAVVGTTVAVVGVAFAVIGAALVSGGQRGPFAVALSVTTALVAVPLGRVLVSGVRLDFDGRYLTSRDLRGRRRVPTGDVVGVEWPGDVSGWVAPDLVLVEGRRVRLGALTRIETRVFRNTLDAHRAVAELSTELGEAARRR